MLCDPAIDVNGQCLEVPEEEVSDLPVKESPAEKHRSQRTVEVGLVLESLNQLEQVLAQLLIRQGGVQPLHRLGPHSEVSVLAVQQLQRGLGGDRVPVLASWVKLNH